jgi:hypothetical protein
MEVLYMGSWGTGIMQDDVVLDVVDEFKDLLKETQNIKETSIKLINDNRELIEDKDEGPQFWIALAKCQWDYGHLDPEVLVHVIQNYDQDKGFDLWKEESKKEYFKRKKVVYDFIQKISLQNPKVKKIPKLIIRKPLFEEGDCLALKISEHSYGAALVTHYDDSSKEYGSNLIIALDYWDDRQPTLDVFFEPQFLHLTYGEWNGAIHKSWIARSGFRDNKDKIIKIGNIDVSKYKNIEDNSYSSWDFLFRLIEKQKTIPELEE